MNRFIRKVMSISAAESWVTPVRQPTGCSHGRFRRAWDALGGESGASVAMLFCHAFVLLVSYYILKTLREPLLLAAGSAEIKSYAQAAIALVLLVFVPLYSHVLRRTKRSDIVRWITLFFLTTLAGLACLGYAGLNVSFAYYVWVGVFGVTMIAQFWAHAADLFTVERGERVFPIILAGSTLGGLVGPLAFRALFPALGPWRLMLLVAVLLVATLPLLAASRASISPSRAADPRPAGPTPRSGGVLGGFALVFNDRYLLLLAALTVVLNCVNTTGEYLLAELVVRNADVQLAADPTLDRNALIGGFYADFFFVVNALTLATQTLLVGRIFRWIGVHGAMLVVPVIALVGYTLAAFVPIFSILRIVKILENSADYSVMSTTRHTLYLPLSTAAKFEGKTTIDTFFWRFGDLLQAAVIFVGLNWLDFDFQHFALLNIALSVIWLAIAVRLGRRYRERTVDENCAPAAPEPVRIRRLVHYAVPRVRRAAVASVLTVTVLGTAAFGTLPARADSNIAQPTARLEQLLAFDAWSAHSVRGARFETDLARKGTLRTPKGEQVTIKLRPASGQDEFNNVPRYEVATYHLQQLFLDEADYVVPPTAFRGLPVEVVHAWGDEELAPPYRESDQVFFVVQYWLQNVGNPEQGFDPARFERDLAYARHVANLNVLTYLIKHKDANMGNVLFSTDPDNPRAFCVDNGVAYRSDESDQGSYWKVLRVPAIPADTVDRLRALDLDTLRAHLRVVSQHRLDGREYTPTMPSNPVAKHGGLQRKKDVLQLGLNDGEIKSVMLRIKQLLKRVDKGRVQTF